MNVVKTTLWNEITHKSCWYYNNIKALIFLGYML